MLHMALLEGTATVHNTKTRMEMEKALALEMFLPVQALNCACQAAAHILRFSALFYLYRRDSVLEQQEPVDRALQMYVLVALHARILYLSDYPTSDGPPIERRM